MRNRIIQSLLAGTIFSGLVVGASPALALYFGILTAFGGRYPPSEDSGYRGASLGGVSANYRCARDHRYGCGGKGICATSTVVSLSMPLARTMAVPPENSVQPISTIRTARKNRSSDLKSLVFWRFCFIV